jgi:hypothetical protein
MLPPPPEVPGKRTTFEITIRKTMSIERMKNPLLVTPALAGWLVVVLSVGCFSYGDQLDASTADEPADGSDGADLYDEVDGSSGDDATVVTDDREDAGIDAGDQAQPDGDSLPDAGSDAWDGSVTDNDAGWDRDGGRPVDDGGSGGIVSGCWITHTSSGETQLDLIQDGSSVTGTLSWSPYSYPIENGILDAQGLRFTVTWTDFGFACDFNFTTASLDFLSGVGICAGLSQDITADRTCP